VSDWGTDCDAEETETCQGLAVFTNPAPSVPDFEIDLDNQAIIYTAYLSAINGKNWVSGIISWGYYAPVILHDKSISIHGKPAENVLQHWFTEFQAQ
jgi:hypothetical protein